VTAAGVLRDQLPQRLQVLERNLDLLARLVEGVSEPLADRPLSPGGSTLRWLLGHLLVGRDRLLECVGGEAVWDRDQAAAFQRGSRPAGGPPLEELLGLLREQQGRLERAFAAVDEGDLGATGAFGTRADELEFGVWHETYHIGQATHFRRAAGLESPIG
jgi:uncharacterized damage-inducible protein DinB